MKRYVVACLAGDGIGPEIMAEASKTLAEVSRLHGFRIEERHVPFGGAAVRRYGRSLPASTREACHSADAILVAATKDPALDDVLSELALTWRIQRVLAEPQGDVVIVSPLHEEATVVAIEHSFEIARARDLRLCSVGSSEEWGVVLGEISSRFPGVTVDRLPTESALPILALGPATVDVVAAEDLVAEALSSMAAYVHNGPRVVASGRLGDDGPGVFGPTHGSAPDIAGQGVANPSGMLLATALMLAEGLGERAAARTLERAFFGTLMAGARTPDMVETGPASTTRDFMEVLLAEIPGARANTETYTEVR